MTKISKIAQSIFWYYARFGTTDIWYNGIRVLLVLNIIKLKLTSGTNIYECVFLTDKSQIFLVFYVVNFFRNFLSAKDTLVSFQQVCWKIWFYLNHFREIDFISPKKII